MKWTVPLSVVREVEDGVVTLVMNPALLSAVHTLTHFSLTGHLHHNRKYLLRETWFRPGQLPHLLYIAPSPDSRVLFFKSLQGTEQMWFFFFSWCFLEKPFSSSREWTQTTTKQALLTQKPSGVGEIQECCRHSGKLKRMFPSFKCFLWPFVNLMHLMWIKLFWTRYCNDSQINCISVRLVIMRLNVILTFWPQLPFERVLT